MGGASSSTKACPFSSGAIGGKSEMGGASSSTKALMRTTSCPFSSGASGGTCPFSGASIEMPVEERVKEMTQGELTSTIAAAGLPTEDCVAVSDLQARAVEAVALGVQRGSVAEVRQEIESALHDRDHVRERRGACVCVCVCVWTFALCLALSAVPARMHCALPWYVCMCVCAYVCVRVCESRCLAFVPRR